MTYRTFDYTDSAFDAIMSADSTETVIDLSAMHGAEKTKRADKLARDKAKREIEREWR